MKKLIYLFTASLFVMTSCSSDDDSNSVDSATLILPKTVINIYSEKTYTAQITYDKNKIVNITHDDGEKISFTYTGEFITKEEDFQNGTLESTTDYAYTNGKLSSKINFEVGDDYKYKTKYIHNADGTVSYEEFRINVSTGVEQEYGNIGKYTFKEGNLIKDESSYYGSESIKTYEYDTKNSPFKNILNYNLLIDEDPSTNNQLKSTYVSGSNTYISTSIYKYDDKGFPTEITRTENGQSDGTTQFKY